VDTESSSRRRRRRRRRRKKRGGRSNEQHGVDRVLAAERDVAVAASLLSAVLTPLLRVVVPDGIERVGVRSEHRAVNREAPGLVLRVEGLRVPPLHEVLHVLHVRGVLLEAQVPREGPVRVGVGQGLGFTGRIVPSTAAVDR
jgi:hypothetical protein